MQINLYRLPSFFKIITRRIVRFLRTWLELSELQWNVSLTYFSSNGIPYTHANPHVFRNSWTNIDSCTRKVLIYCVISYFTSPHYYNTHKIRHAYGLFKFYVLKGWSAILLKLMWMFERDNRKPGRKPIGCSEFMVFMVSTHLTRFSTPVKSFMNGWKLNASGSGVPDSCVKGYEARKNEKTKKRTIRRSLSRSRKLANPQRKCL